MSFRIELAEGVAQQLVARLTPFSERICIAGSIRRRCTQVNDVDIVVVPKLAVRKAGLFGGEEREPLEQSQFYGELRNTIGIAQGGEKLIRGYCCLGIADTAPLPVDVYIATPETWATLLLIRTGSAAHNVFLCSRARELGGRLHADGSGLELPGAYCDQTQRFRMDRFIPQDEDELLAKLCWGAKPRPEERECGADRRPKWLAANSEVRTQNAGGSRR